MRTTKPILALLLATVWISASEFIRNEFLFKDYWLDHYAGLGLTFPSEPINGMVWGLWSLCLAIGIYFISRKFSFKETTLISWGMAFVLMWIVTGNMMVLPFKLLYFAVPLSVIEVVLAVFIITRVCPPDHVNETE
jgi:hypothetical protein